MNDKQSIDSVVEKHKLLGVNRVILE